MRASSRSHDLGPHASQWGAGARGQLFDEAEELELAAQLLEITSDQELDQFLGKLIKRAWRGVRKFAGKVVRPLGKVLKTVAKKALPFLAGAAGSLLGPAGTALGTAAGAALSKALELELEGLGGDEREFEAARRFVRLAGAAARNAAMAEPDAELEQVLRQAMQDALQQEFPGLLAAPRRRSGGRWARRGGRIVLYGV
ncbi:MAG TPA: hypothetical protein PKD53_06150 [Chloroflexaceae bacterium]|nr:hypothetical protein [Chloroflexaceae bacterium]